MSNAQSNDLLRELNAKLLAEIAELRKENAEIKAKNTKLKQDKEDIEARFAKLEQSDKEKTDLIAKLEWDVSQIKQASVTSQLLISPSIKNHSDQDDSTDSVNLEQTQSAISPEPMPLPLLCNANTVTNGHDREEIIPSPLPSDAKTVTNGHDQNNVYVNSVNISEVFESDDQIVENLIREMSHDHTQSFISSKNDSTSLDISGSGEISKSCIQNIIPGSAQSLSYLFDKAVKKGQKEILCWYYYSLEFENKVKSLTTDGKITDKTARTKIYKEMKSFLPNITDVNLRKKTQRARKILTLFGRGGVGIAKIKQISYSARTISGLTNAQIQYIINHVTSKTVTNGHDQILTSEVCDLSSQATNSFSSKKLSEIKVSTSSASQHKDPTHDRIYFCNKTLEQYPNLYKDGNSENVDYYGITDETLCPLCELDHDDDEDIEGRYKIGSYYIKCEQRGIEIEANKTLTPEYLEWNNKFTGLPSVLTDKIRSKLYKRYKKETGLDPWMDSKPSESFEEKTLFVPRVNVQSTPSKSRSPIS
ncbi:5500_t:CDS:2, partial [Racocetra fulgida]